MERNGKKRKGKKGKGKKRNRRDGKRTRDSSSTLTSSSNTGTKRNKITTKAQAKRKQKKSRAAVRRGGGGDNACRFANTTWATTAKNFPKQKKQQARGMRALFCQSRTPHQRCRRHHHSHHPLPPPIHATAATTTSSDAFYPRGTIFCSFLSQFHDSPNPVQYTPANKQLLFVMSLGFLL